MTEQNDAGGTPGLASGFKRAVRRLLLWVLAIPVVVVGALLALPYLLPDDPELHLGEVEQNRALMVLAGSLIAMYVVHILTKSWSRPAQPSGEEGPNGN